MGSSLKLVKERPHRHITMACDACRAKRCKCDGHIPCSRCHRTGDSCCYNATDQRRRSARLPAVNEEALSLGGLPNRQGVGGSRFESHTNVQAAMPDTLSGDQASEEFISRATPCDSDAELRRELPSIEQMQTRFKVESRASNHEAHAGRVGADKRSRRTLLPKESFAASRYTTAVRGSLEIRTKTGQSAQQPIQRGYPVPGYTRTFGNLPFSSSVVANGYSSDIQTHQSLIFSTPHHLVLPLAEQDDSPLGRALTGFQKLAKDMMASGVPLSAITGHGPIDVTLFFQTGAPNVPINVSTWTAEMLRSFRGTFSDELLLACAACVVHLLRWMLAPTPENYADMPSMIRPTSLQRLKPHPAWVDLMMFPSFRDALTNSVRDWVEPCMKAEWSLLPTESMESILIRPSGSQNVYLSTGFAAHVDNPRSWSMRRNILDHFPEIEGSEIHILPQ